MRLERIPWAGPGGARRIGAAPAARRGGLQRLALARCAGRDTMRRTATTTTRACGSSTATSPSAPRARSCLAPGDRLMLPRGTVHTATAGPRGATYLIGERWPVAAQPMPAFLAAWTLRLRDGRACGRRPRTGSVAPPWRCRGRRSASLRSATRVYAVGGFAGSAPSAAVEAYDTRSDRWTFRRRLPAALHHVVVVCGRRHPLRDRRSRRADGERRLGRDVRLRPRDGRMDGALRAAATARRRRRRRDRRAASTLSAVCAATPRCAICRSTIRWPTPGPSSTAMPTARDHLAAGAIDGRLYAVGGRNGGELFDVVEVFDPRTGSWSAGRAPHADARAAASGPPCSDGLLYAFGGEGNPDSPFGTFPRRRPTTLRATRGAACPTWASRATASVSQPSRARST